MDKDKTITERLKDLENFSDKVKEKQEPKPKKFKLPFKGNVSKQRLKQGYVTVMIIGDNKEISYTRAPIIGSTIKLEKEYLSIHSLNSNDIFTYKGKPFVMIYKGKLNPYNPFEGKHETRGQEYVSARMFSDQITKKKSLGSVGWIIGGVILLVIIYALVSGGGGGA